MKMELLANHLKILKPIGPKKAVNIYSAIRLIWESIKAANSFAE